MVVVAVEFAVVVAFAAAVGAGVRAGGAWTIRHLVLAGAFFKRGQSADVVRTLVHVEDHDLVRIELLGFFRVVDEDEVAGAGVLSAIPCLRSPAPVHVRIGPGWGTRTRQMKVLGALAPAEPAGMLRGRTVAPPKIAISAGTLFERREIAALVALDAHLQDLFLEIFGEIMDASRPEILRSFLL